MEFICCLLSVGGGIWLAMSLHQSSKEKRQAQQATGSESMWQPATPQLPPWPVRESLQHTQEWLAAVADAARAADRLGAAVPLAEIEAYVDEGWKITACLAGKIDVLKHTRG